MQISWKTFVGLDKNGGVVYQDVGDGPVREPLTDPDPGSDYVPNSVSGSKLDGSSVDVHEFRAATVSLSWGKIEDPVNDNIAGFGNRG